MNNSHEHPAQEIDTNKNKSDTSETVRRLGKHARISLGVSEITVGTGALFAMMDIINNHPEVSSGVQKAFGAAAMILCTKGLGRFGMTGFKDQSPENIDKD